MERVIKQYDEDVKKNKGYVYTTNKKISSTVANNRLTLLTLEFLDLSNKKILDIGCGDGTYTHELFMRSKPKLMVGLDASKEAIKIAKEKYKEKNLFFEVQNCYNLSFTEFFDVAILRGVLHHLENPLALLKILPRFAKTILIIEPNGNNPVLKIMEKMSSYHSLHDEKSYSSIALEKLIENAGCNIVAKKYAGFVPFFCPYILVKVLKKIEPIIEKTPLLRNFICAVYCLKIERNNHNAGL